MKKVKSNNRSSAAKGNGAPKNVDEYLAGVPQPARSTLNKIRAAIRSAVPPEATETISYRIPAFKYKGVLVWFAAFSNHCSLFPTVSVVEAFKNELKAESSLAASCMPGYLAPPFRARPATEAECCPSEHRVRSVVRAPRRRRQASFDLLLSTDMFFDQPKYRRAS